MLCGRYRRDDFSVSGGAANAFFSKKNVSVMYTFHVHLINLKYFHEIPGGTVHCTVHIGRY